MTSPVEYSEFLVSKRITDGYCGMPDDDIDIHSMLYDFQRAVTRWALMKGRCAVWADCGLGKTFIELEWAKNVSAYTDKPVLIFAPLAVTAQTKREGVKLGLDVRIVRSPEEIEDPGVYIANYEMAHVFNPDVLGGIVADESSILKSFTGKTRNLLIHKYGAVPFRLAASATPAPNDTMELANHAEFLGAMKRSEMLATFFVHDSGDTSKWRLKKHGAMDFWKWVASWAVLFRTPDDIGFDASRYVLPPLHRKQIIVGGEELNMELVLTLDQRRAVRRGSIAEKAERVVGMIQKGAGQWLIWCDLNPEQDVVCAALKAAGISFVSVEGSTSYDKRIEYEQQWREGVVDVLVTKPKIFSFGLNWQHCHQVVFIGMSDSFEAVYQAIRRCWRFGQLHDVTMYMVCTPDEGPVVKNIAAKEDLYKQMIDGMLDYVKDTVKGNIQMMRRDEQHYETQTHKGNRYRLIMGDCVEVLKSMKDESVGMSVFSPPFATLYTYSALDRDMGNSRSYEAFSEHFSYFVAELYRVMKSGRQVAVHCMNLPVMKEREGYIGIRDFRGDLIRAFQRAGFIYHSEVCIWKNPVAQMTRTKSIGLLYKQLRKDSNLSRQGLPDYLVIFRKTGTNVEPITKEKKTFPVTKWQRYASPVWFDIKEGDVLKYRDARGSDDERHICPLQLGVIQRALRLWSNRGDVVLDPFMGIGSSGHVALKLGRRFLGVELKKSYFDIALRNVKDAERFADRKMLTKLYPEWS